MGLHGISKGGDLALSYVSFIRDRVKACIVQSSTVSSIWGKTTFGDRVVDKLKFDMGKVKAR